MSMTPKVEIRRLRHVYSKGTPYEKEAISGVDLEFPGGQFVGLIGQTGSGKSTFIQHLNGLLLPSDGEILIDGENISKSKETLRAVRFRVGLVFQYPEYQLFEETVYKDIAFGPRNMKLGASEIDERVREAAGFVGIREELFETSPFELSGGQKRRVAIAGVIAMRPEILVLDEPTAGLDPRGRLRILENIEDYREKTGATVILVSHNMEEIARVAERIIVFEDGKVVEDGSPELVFSEANRLREMGLDVPVAARIAANLREMGASLPSGIYTIEQLTKAITGLREGDGNAS